MFTSPADTAPAAPRRAWSAMLAGAVVSAALLCGLAGFALLQGRAQYEERAALLAQNLAAAIDHSVSANVEKVDLALSSIVDHLEHQLAAGRIDRDAAAAHIRSQVARRSELEGVRVTDAQGLGILGPGLEGRPPINFADRQWFQAQRDGADAGFYLSPPLVSRITGQWIVSFSRRYRDAQGRFAGAVSAAVPLA
jgi:hypothetical protein